MQGVLAGTSCALVQRNNGGDRALISVIQKRYTARQAPI
jgi:hypothetical protein